MERFDEYCARVGKEMCETMEKVDEAEAQRFMEEIMKAKRIFIAGQGRCLIALRAFAMRLMHLGFTTYIVWDTTTPAIGEGDLLIIGSAAGKTETMRHVAQKAKEAGATFGFLTMVPDSPIGQYADFYIHIYGRTSDCGGIGTSIQPGGGRFEQGMFIYGDCIIAKLGEKLGYDPTKPYGRHTNLE